MTFSSWLWRLERFDSCLWSKASSDPHSTLAPNPTPPPHLTRFNHQHPQSHLAHHAPTAITALTRTSPVLITTKTVRNSQLESSDRSSPTWH